jgi:hypothetical protein
MPAGRVRAGYLDRAGGGIRGSNLTSRRTHLAALAFR